MNHDPVRADPAAPRNVPPARRLAGLAIRAFAVAAAVTALVVLGFAAPAPADTATSLTLTANTAAFPGNAGSGDAGSTTAGSIVVTVAGPAAPPASVLGLMAAEPSVVAVKTLPEVIASLMTWIVSIAFGVASLFATIAGLLYLTAGGDTAQVDRAKTALKSALIGYGIALLAPVLLGIASEIVGG
jgi:hypothetical protein